MQPEEVYTEANQIQTPSLGLGQDSTFGLTLLCFFLVFFFFFSIKLPGNVLLPHVGKATTACTRVGKPSAAQHLPGTVPWRQSA